MPNELDLQKIETVPAANQSMTSEAMLTGEQEKTEEKVIIHTMPKRFYHSTAGSEKSRNVGIIIMVLGFFVLVGIAIFSYFFLIQPGNQALNSVGVEKTKNNIEQKSEVLPKKEDSLATSSSDVFVEETIDEELEDEYREEDLKDELIDETEELVSEKRELVTVPDTDNDGLTDTEEAMLGTIANLRDSDSDGYDDYSEFLGLYNPAGSGSLITNQNIEKYTNIKNGYTLYYLKKMTVENAGGSEDSVIFSFFDGQMIQIVAEPNVEKLSLEDWYKKQFGVSFIEEGQRLYKKGWTGIRSEDGLTVYLVNPASDKVFSLNYNINTDNKLSRKAFFDMMVNSFSL